MATEKRLIRLDEALEATHKEVFWTKSEQAAVRSFLVKLPRVDAVEVVHGQMEEIEPCQITVDRQCCLCGIAMGCKDNYCPNCGAKMDGGTDNA